MAQGRADATASGTKDHPVWASVQCPLRLGPSLGSKYDDLVVLLALNPIREESIILSGTAGTEYGRLPWLALSQAVLGGHTSNAASEAPGRGCHSIAPAAYHVGLADFKFHGDDILRLEMIVLVCLRDGKEAVEQLKAIYPDEAKNAELDIMAKFKVLKVSWHYSIDSEALAGTGSGSTGSAQHPKPNAVVGSSSSSDPPFSGDDVESSWA